MFKTVIVSTALALTIAISPAQAGTGDAQVYIVHGIPGQDVGLDPSLPVDISVDGSCEVTDFRFGEIIGPVGLPAGARHIAIFLDDGIEGTACSGDAALSASVDLLAGEYYSIVAHLTEDGGLTAGVFVNDLSATSPGRARLIAQHTAAAMEVDISLVRGGTNSPGLMVPDVANGDQLTTELKPGSWFLSIAPAGMSVPVFGPAEVTFSPFTAYLVYAVGTPGQGSFTLLIEPVGELKP